MLQAVNMIPFCRLIVILRVRSIHKRPKPQKRTKVDFQILKHRLKKIKTLWLFREAKEAAHSQKWTRKFHKELIFRVAKDQSRVSHLLFWIRLVRLLKAKIHLTKNLITAIIVNSSRINTCSLNANTLLKDTEVGITKVNFLNIYRILTSRQAFPSKILKFRI